MLLIAGLVLLFLLPTPWNVIAFLVGLLLWLGEVFAIWRLVRKKQVQTGARDAGRANGHGDRAVPAARPGAPLGESEIWRARCAEGADAGETVRVVGDRPAHPDRRALT